METIKYTENVIPVMTSDTSPSGVASASSSWMESYIFPAYKAFDHATSGHVSGWATARNVNTGWLEYDFATVKCITKYTITPRDWAEYINQLPKDWTFEAYDDSIGDWVVLDTQTNITDWKVLTKKEYTFTNANFYTNYRINVSQNNGGTIVTIDELEMMETFSQGAKATMYITIFTGEIKEYHVDSATDYLTWYDNRSNGSGKAYYTFTKDTTGGFLSRKEYLSFDKISSFEIMEYDD